MSRQSLLQSGPKCDVCASFRAHCELVFARTHKLAIGVDVDGPNRPLNQEDDCKELSHWHSIALSSVTGP